MQPAASYLRQHPRLEEAVAACPPTRNHSALLDLLRRESALTTARLATTRGGRWLHRRQVFDAAGTRVADDHEAWLADQVARDDGHVGATCTRLAVGRYHLSQCQITNLYLAVPGPTGAPSDFLQIEIDVEDEVLDRELSVGHTWRTPRTLADLQHEADQGDVLPDAERVSVRPSAYRLRRIVDVGAWLRVADALEAVRREAFRERRYRVTPSSGPSATIKTPDELWPGWDRFPAKHRRFFEDWQRSSAGAYPLCEHWALQLTDWTDQNGRRTLDMVPMWTFHRPLAKIDARKGGDYEFYGALQKLDRRVGVPFGWYFYLLHGNRVESDAGERVIRAAEAGTIVLPERDYRVLKEWEASPYGF